MDQALAEKLLKEVYELKAEVKTLREENKKLKEEVAYLKKELAKKERVVPISDKELSALVARAKKVMSPEDYEIIRKSFVMIEQLSLAYNREKGKLSELLQTFFGPKTEKRKAKSSGKKEKKQGTNNGKNGEEKYTGAKRVHLRHQRLKSGDMCPECPGKIYLQKDPGIIIRITGDTPLNATVYEVEKLRCNLCGKLFTAEVPEEVGPEKYDAKAGSLIALMRYGLGVPFYRLDALQTMLGVPLPSSTQWDIVECVADKIYLIYEELIKQAAYGEIFYNDDTTVRILSLMAENSSEDVKRKGMFTTGIISKLHDIKIALFFSGREHAGENLAKVLIHRPDSRGAPIQMCDALQRNIPAGFNLINAYCLSHARRNFIKAEDQSPEESASVINKIGEIYKHDKTAKTENMTPEERLRYHQQHSKPIIEELYTWISQQYDKEKEPNSSLGKAMKYMLKHEEKLTTFLRVAGTPLDNNECERALKKAILHRKNSLFYKNEHGADIGDIFISLFQTCQLNGINPFEYLVALQENSKKAKATPEKWLPWNYELNLQT